MCVFGVVFVYMVSHFVGVSVSVSVIVAYLFRCTIRCDFRVRLCRICSFFFWALWNLKRIDMHSFESVVSGFCKRNVGLSFNWITNSECVLSASEFTFRKESQNRWIVQKTIKAELFLVKAYYLNSVSLTSQRKLCNFNRNHWVLSGFGVDSHI